MGHKFNRTIKRIESQRFRLVVLVIGCFLVSMTFVVVSKPQTLAFVSSSSKKTPPASPDGPKDRDIATSKNLDVEDETGQSSISKVQEKPSTEEAQEKARQLESKDASEPGQPNSENKPSADSNYPTVDMTQGKSNTPSQQENKSEKQELEKSNTEQQDNHPHGEQVHHRITLPTISNYTINDSVQDDSSNTPQQSGGKTDQELTAEEGINATPNLDNPAQEETKTEPEQPQNPVQTQERSTVCDNPMSGQCTSGDSSRPIVPESTTVDQTPKANNGEFKPAGAGFMKVQERTKPLCNVSHPRVDLCEAEGDLRIHQDPSSPIYVEIYEPGAAAKDESWQIQPYARKGDNVVFTRVRQVVVKSSKEVPECTDHHGAPALIFSTGGYVGNLFHDFTDVILPLFLTAQQFDGEVELIITDKHDWWVRKYASVLQKVSKYPVIDIDRDDKVHCFKKVLVGLRCHRELSVEPGSPLSLADFTQFMRSSYSLPRDAVSRLGEFPGKRPRLLIVARKRTRSFTNLPEVVQMAEELGYEVVVDEADVGSNIAKFAAVVNSCDVMMGVHGAGLTNMVFLPVNATMIQLVPWGGLEGIAMMDFGHAASNMKLNYLQYSVNPEESSLINEYPRDHVIFRDPYSYHNKGWDLLRKTFMDQNVKLDVVRFRDTLLKAIDQLQP